MSPTVNLDELEARFREQASHLAPMPLDKSKDDQTIYDILQGTPAASSFLEHLDQHPSVASLLKDTENGEYTVFVPANDAAPPPGAEAAWVEAHVSPHYVSIETMACLANAASVLRDEHANGPQIVRLRAEGATYQVNRTSTIAVANVVAKNGMLHFLDGTDVPPGTARQAIQARKDLSQFNKALRLVEDADQGKGRTIFAPNDDAFAALGEEVATFLEGEGGQAYLAALIKCHILLGKTVYTNFVWPDNDKGERLSSADKMRTIKGQRTLRFPSLAGNEVAVHVARYNSVIEMILNESAKVADSDVMASDGVVQVLVRVLLPNGQASSPGMTLAAFREIMQPFIAN